MNEQVIIIGAGGHAKVISDIIIKNNDKIIGFIDDNKFENENFLGYKIIGNIKKILDIQIQYKNCKFIIAIGDNKTRKLISERFNIPYYNAIHPSSIIGMNVSIGEGTCIMANSVINPSTKIGKHCIINTSCVIEHDNIIEDYVHICPNVSLGGSVSVGLLTQVGIGSIVKNNIKISGNCLIGAGALVVKDINQPGIYIGVPVKKFSEIGE